MDLERFPSGQREQTVNLPAMPSEVRILPSPPDQLADEGMKKRGKESLKGCRLYCLGLDIDAGVAQLAEHQPSKLRVAGSIPVSRSMFGELS